MSCSHSPGDSALKSLPQRALTDFNAEGVTQAPPVVLDSWKTPFAVADPMSNVRTLQDVGATVSL